MSAINKKWLKDKEDNYIAPRTLTSAIQDEDGNSFQEYADKMIIIDEEETTEIPKDLTSCVTNQDMYNIVSDAYDSTKTYVVGDYCIYNNILYKCTTPIETAEEFDSSKWDVTSVDSEISELNNKLIQTTALANINSRLGFRDLPTAGDYLGFKVTGLTTQQVSIPVLILISSQLGYGTVLLLSINAITGNLIGWKTLNDSLVTDIEANVVGTTTTYTVKFNQTAVWGHASALYDNGYINVN